MAARTEVRRLIEAFKLQAHPEGGFFRESYRASESIQAHGGSRSLSTGIYFLIPEGAMSRLHRLKSDEVWHFYLGGPLDLTQILPDGTIGRFTMGQEVESGQRVQHVVPAGAWFGAKPLKGSGYSFVGCTVSPGFDFADFEMGKRSDLVRQFPSAKAVIESLTD